MTLYNVHIYREMRLTYDGIEAETHEDGVQSPHSGETRGNEAVFAVYQP